MSVTVLSTGGTIASASSQQGATPTKIGEELISDAVDRGGHVRVGLEDAPLGSDRTNVEWTKHARSEIKKVGGTLATPAEIRTTLDK